MTGDGALVEFPSVVDAVRAAIKFQRYLSDRYNNQPDNKRLEFRIGVNLGDVLVDGDDIQGDGVNIAARLEGLAESGGICISDNVHEQIRNRLDVEFSNLGERRVKNVETALKVWHWKNAPNKSAMETGPSRSDTSEDQRLRIAVLPFNNMSGDPEQEYFSDGITEDIITELSKISALFVVARNTTFTYKNRPQNLQDVAGELSVDHIVEGSVRKAGNRVRITAQLIDGRSGGHLWAEKYDRELINIFEVQDEITAEITSALKIVLQPEDLQQVANSRPRNLDAYDLFLQGRRQQHIFTKPNLERAIQLFQKSASIDPNYARAFCGIADSNAFLFQFYEGSRDLRDEIDSNSAKALALAPDMAEAHASRGYYFFVVEKFDDADSAFERAVKLDPELYEAHYYWGRAHMARGNAKEAEIHLSNALAVSPRDDQSGMLLMQILEDQGKSEETLQIAQRTVENALRKQEREPENIRSYLSAAFGFYRLNDMESVRKQIIMAQSLDPEEQSIHYNLACLYALIGDQDNALDRLEHCVRLGEFNKKWIEHDSDWDALRTHPRFVALFDVQK